MRLVRKFFPWFFPAFNIIAGYAFDCYRFVRFNTNNAYRLDNAKHEAIIRRRYHGIEKAFSLPNVRKGFGVNNCSDLADELIIYYGNNGYNGLVESTLDVFNNYIDFHRDYNSKEVHLLTCKLSKVIESISEYKKRSDSLGGTIKVNHDSSLYSNKAFDFDTFCKSRYTVRDFSDDPVNQKIISKSIETAIKTPSVCNRQAWKVHVFQGDAASHVLEYQNGSRGFKSHVDTVLLVTGLVSSFSNSERNQVFIDGGLFSMSLIYALHDNNLAVCALNTAYKVKAELALKNAIELPNNEVPIMMLAVGNYKKDYSVAKSYRKSLCEVAVYH
ncbi:nitroreductase family protein [Photobacterium sp. J15]|uniref:nitroreductase family protein n=1 Tax=Photobacterium sp. J15 TaxID=265901 RepID=UPI0007E39F1C|nr:nitroreductase family protein [Photobacterium sp. J15]